MYFIASAARAEPPPHTITRRPPRRYIFTMAALVDSLKNLEMDSSVRSLRSQEREAAAKAAKEEKVVEA